MATTANTIVNDAWALNGVPNPGTTRLLQGLRLLNDMISGWVVEQLTVPFLTVETFSTIVGQGTMTIGQSGSPDISTVRPIDIADSMYISDGSGTDFRVFKMSKFQYNDITTKGADARPEKFAYEPEYPNGKIYFDKEPEAVETATIDAIKQITEFASLSTAFNLPPEYKKILKYNLALDIAPTIGNVLDQIVVSQAILLKKKLKALNIQPVKPTRMDTAMTYTMRRG
jgi:hypothetical protein